MTTVKPTDGKPKILDYSHTIGLCVMQGRGFMFPVDTLIAKNGRMHTVSRGSNSPAAQLRITLYDINSEYYGVYGGYDDGLRWPVAIASDNEGNVFISDEQSNRINIYGENGSFVGYWGVSGYKFGELRGPSGIAFDSSDDLYISDHLNNRIQKFSKDGRPIMSFGNDKSGDDNLELPWGLTIASDNCIYVADWGNHRVKKYSDDGTLIRIFGSPGCGNGEFRNPSGVAVADDGYIYVSDWGNERVQILDMNGTFIAQLRGEATISKWGQDLLDDKHEEEETRSRCDLEPDKRMFGGNPHEESAQIEKLFWGTTSVKLDDAGRLYVTESNRHRVQVYERL